jgi:hypothetical protein
MIPLEAMLDALREAGIPIDWTLVHVGFACGELGRDDVLAFAAARLADAPTEQRETMAALAALSRRDSDRKVRSLLRALLDPVALPQARRIWIWYRLTALLARLSSLLKRASESLVADVHVTDLSEELRAFWRDALERFCDADERALPELPAQDCRPTRAGVTQLLERHVAWAAREASMLGLGPSVTRGAYR